MDTIVSDSGYNLSGQLQLWLIVAYRHCKQQKIADNGDYLNLLEDYIKINLSGHIFANVSITEYETSLFS